MGPKEGDKQIKIEKTIANRMANGANLTDFCITGIWSLFKMKKSMLTCLN